MQVVQADAQENCKVLTRRGQVHVFGQYIQAIGIRVSRKMDQTPDFAVLQVDAAPCRDAMTGA
jgi:hypothetical protein